MKPEAYIPLEDTMVSVLQSSWLADAYDFKHVMADLLGQGLIQQAYQLLSNTTMEGTLDKVKEGFREVGVSALLFGASSHSPLEETELYVTKAVPEVLLKQFDLLKNSIEQKGWTAIKDNVRRVIEAHEEDLRAGAYRKMDSDELSIKLNEAVLNPVKMLYAAGANVTTSRLVSYGFLAEAVSKDVSTYQVTEVLDGVTCAVCGYMHGKTFTVTSEFARLSEVMFITDPDELKQSAPWPKNSKEALVELYAMDADALQAKGWGSPPYHPLCRGLMTLTGSISETILPTPTPNLNPSPEPSLTETGSNSGGWKDKITRSLLTTAELDAITSYMNGGYSAVNELLRNPASSLSFAELVAIQQSIGVIDSAISRGQVTGPLTVYRGVSSTKPIFGVTDTAKLVDKEVTELAYLSVGSLEQAMTFAGEAGAVLKIKLGAGVKALVPSDYEGLPAVTQMELLLQRGLRLRVVSAYTENGITYIDVAATQV